MRSLAQTGFGLVRSPSEGRPAHPPLLKCAGRTLNAAPRSRKCTGIPPSFRLRSAYKKDIEDVRESPAVDFIRILQSKGAIVTYTDSWVPTLEHEGIDLKSIEAGPAVDHADAVVIITDHSNVPYADVVKRARLVLDARNATRGIDAPNIVRL